MLLDHTPQMILSQFKDFGPFFALEAEVERVCVCVHTGIHASMCLHPELF